MLGKMLAPPRSTSLDLANVTGVVITFSLKTDVDLQVKTDIFP